MLPPPRNAIFDAHHGGAGRDRLLHVGRHAHGQRVEAEPRLQLVVQALRLQQISGRARRRDRHEAAQAKTRQAGDRRGEPGDFRHGDAALGRFAGDVHFDEHIERRHPSGPLFGQAVGDFYPVDSLHPVEALCSEARLVALERTDQVPLRAGRERHFPHCFLHVVLAERVEPRSLRLRDARAGMSLRNCQQSHRSGVAAGGPGGARDACFHSLHVFENHCHNSLNKRRKGLRAATRENCNGSH
jgi:hypothetical protein